MSERRLAVGLWIFLCALATLPILLTEYPPLQDYPQWVFQGAISAAVLRSDPTAASAYGLRIVPVPNLGAIGLIGGLSGWLAPETAGRVGVAVLVLVFALAFGSLTRAVQGRVTAAQYL